METIVAIATPPGRGGVGIVRISGPNAYALGLRLSGLEVIKLRYAQYVSFYIENNVIDQGILLYFKGPNSFTGEDIIEIQAHGSPIVLDKIVKECIATGLARIANPGEFSERAFLNDKIDLTQAEAIADLINASSETAARLAMRSLQGDFSSKINSLCEEMIYLRLYVEAAIDFPDEEIDFLGDGKVASMLREIMQKLDAILKTAQCGSIIREGLNVVIAGSPNAGKSTLINYLSGRDVAIVTDIPGTTRDIMREHILLGDIPINIIDTAGIRESQDVIEQEGIKRAINELQSADIVLLLVDINNKDAHIDKYLQNLLPPNVPVINVLNKIDTLPDFDKTLQTFFANADSQQVYISAKSGVGIDNLIAKIKQIVGFQPAEGQFLARLRHLEALEAAKTLLGNGQLALETNLSGELLAEDLRLAHQELTKITGEFSSDDLLGAIFSSFCIGK